MILELLNSEGPILSALRIEDHVILIDEKKEVIRDFSITEFRSFISGQIDVTDSLDRKINFLKFGAAKPDEERLAKFMK